MAPRTGGLARMGTQLRPALAEGDRTEAARLDEVLERYPNHGGTFGIKLDVVAARPRAPAHPSGVKLKSARASNASRPPRVSIFLA